MTGAGWQAVQFALLSLAAYRLWRLAGADVITERLRRRLGDTAREFVECPWCSGTWIALATVAITAVISDVAAPVLQALAAAAVVGALGERATAVSAEVVELDDGTDGA